MEKIEKDTHIPFYIQIMEIIQKRITDGQYRPGSQLPSELKLAEEFSVTRTTVRRSLDELKRAGRIVTEHGKGSIVSYPKIEQSLLNFYSFGREVGSSGMAVKSRLIEIKNLVCPPFVSHVLVRERSDSDIELYSFDKVYSVVRLRYIHGIPLVLESSYLPLQMTPQLEQKDLTEDSIYDVLENSYNISVGKAKEYLLPKTANEHEAALLEIQPGDAVFQTERVTFDSNKNIIEVRNSIIRGDKLLFTTELL